MSPDDAVINKKIKFCEIVDKKLKLKRTHPYYYKVQGQLKATDRKHCLFFVWTPKDISNEKNYYDVIPMLALSFYLHFISELQ